jgi:ABC-type multidrug transport system fused ATPase/permease subunit
MFLVLVSRMNPYISGLANQYGSLFSNLPALTRLNAFLAKDFPVESGGDHAPRPVLTSALELQNVTHAYVPGTAVLQDVSLTVPRGGYIGIQGPSGSGKSTLFALLTRLYDPTGGRILIDGVDLREFHLPCLRAAIGLLSQDVFLFNTTIRDNLLIVRPHASEDDLRKALEKAGLQDFIDAQDQGMDAPVGNNGELLSGGQRQRLSLAILFLQDPEVIVLDEGTSAVDAETERHILRSLGELHRRGKTIICSAHKETALADVERVYHLRDGRLTQVR